MLGAGGRISGALAQEVARFLRAGGDRDRARVSRHSSSGGGGGGGAFLASGFRTGEDRAEVATGRSSELNALRSRLWATRVVGLALTSSSTIFSFLSARTSISG